MTERQLRLQIVATGKHLANKGYIPATDGNISCRINSNDVLITPSGFSKGDLHTDELVLVSLNGKVLRGNGKPSSEIDMHLTAYRIRPDVKAVVHAHPPHATAFALAHIALEVPALPEIILTLNKIPLTKYATPGTREVGESISELIKNYDALLLRNHGVLTVGTSLKVAADHMERAEHFAHILFLARQLGGEQPLTPEQVARIFGNPSLREKTEYHT